MKQLDKLVQNFYIHVILPPSILILLITVGIFYNIHSQYILFNKESSVFILFGGIILSVLIGLRLNVKWTIASLIISEEPKNFELRRRSLVGMKIFLKTKTEHLKLQELFHKKVYNGTPISFPKDKKVIYYSKWKSIGDTLLYWGFLFLGIRKTKAQEIMEMEMEYLIILAVFAILLFLLGFNTFWKIFNQNPVLILSTYGIETNKGNIIGWDKVKSFFFDTKNRVLEIECFSDEKNHTEYIDFSLMQISKDKLEYYVELYFRQSVKNKMQ